MRISFLGGGTDYPDYFRKHGGQTLGATIDKYIYLTVSRLPALFDYSTRVSYSRVELVDNLEEIVHPAVRECLRFLELDGGIEMNVVADLPARTGLGSSSSFTVGLLHALHAFKGEMVSNGQLAEEAVYVEQEMIKEREKNALQKAEQTGLIREAEGPRKSRRWQWSVTLNFQRLLSIFTNRSVGESYRWPSSTITSPTDGCCADVGLS